MRDHKLNGERTMAKPTAEKLQEFIKSITFEELSGKPGTQNSKAA